MMWMKKAHLILKLMFDRCPSHDVKLIKHGLAYEESQTKSIMSKSNTLTVQWANCVMQQFEVNIRPLSIT